MTEHIPAELKSRPQWVVYRAIARPDGRTDKVPHNPLTGGQAMANNPSTWGTYQDALQRCVVDAFDGIGYVFTDDDGLAGLDLDHCVGEDGAIEAWALQIVQRLNSYTELSHSGGGLHVLVRGILPVGQGNRNGRLEMYDRGRFFTVTGRHLEGTPATIEDRRQELRTLHAEVFGDRQERQTAARPPAPVDLADQELLARATGAQNGAKFQALWDGDSSGYPSPSEADLALCDLLAFWTGRDPERIDRLFRQSGLYRDKWERADYRDGTIAKAIAGADDVYKPPDVTIPSRLGQRLSRDVADAVVSVAPDPPDPELRNAIIGALLERQEEGKRMVPAILRRRKAGELLLAWMGEHGGFVQSTAGEQFYFWRSERRLFNLETAHFAAWLYSLSGCNPAGTDYAHLLADCKAAALSAPRRSIIKLAAWDGANEVLRVSRFDGTVYVLDGTTIEEEANGEHVLFLDDQTWIPYEPAFSGPAALHWHTSELPNWQDKSRGYGLALRAWILSIFFTELCPTRPFLAMIGEKGAGKTMILRLLLRFLFGPLGEVSGVPDKPDSFTTAAAAAHLLALDNLDGFHGWLRDKMARLATGGVDEMRQLYTTKELLRIRYRCWMAFTSRTPDTLRRDDLADRLVILPLKRLEEPKAERDFLNLANILRGEWWGGILTALNELVAMIRDGQLTTNSHLRMADWESIGRLVAQAEGKLEAWDAFIAELKRSQSDLLLEDDLLVEGLTLWLNNPANHGREVTAKTLQGEMGPLLFGDRPPPTDWPKSASGFGRRLSSIKRDLRALFDVWWGKGTTRETHNRAAYCFWPEGQGPDGGEMER